MVRVSGEGEQYLLPDTRGLVLASVLQKVFDEALARQGTSIELGSLHFQDQRRIAILAAVPATAVGVSCKGGVLGRVSGRWVDI